jgi:hypothetical protein
MNKRSEISHLYNSLPWRHQADLFLFGVFLLARQRLIPADRRVAQQFHFINDRRCVKASPLAKGALLIAATLNLGVWVFALPVVPNIAAPIVATHLVGLTALFLFHPNPALARQQAPVLDQN